MTAPAPASRTERRLAAIMFTDMVGSTALAQRDESLAMRLRDEQRRLVRSALPRHNGREVQTTGDGFLVEFASALEAVECAAAIQSALGEANASRPAAEAFQIRIGIHLGDVLHAGADVGGDAVNIAARVQALADPGGICVTAQVQASVLNKVEYIFESLGAPPLKNVLTPVEVFRLAGFGSPGASEAASPAGLPKHRVAVLPFANISADPADEYFADGMTEEILSCLSRAPGLRVIARTSVMRYKDARKRTSEIGRELNVGTLLEGSVRKSGDKVRITVQLIDTSSEEPYWSQDYDRQLVDVFAIQSDIASRVSAALRASVLPAASAADLESTSNTEAYLHYLRGRQFWNKRTQEDLYKAVEFFESALALDPRFGRAYCGLADSYAVLALLEFMPPHQAFPKAKQAVEQALALDSQLPEAHASSGLIRFQYDWDWQGAESELRQAIALNPSYASAHQFLADLLKALGRFEEALEQIERARELDPLSLAINTAVGHVLYLSRQYDRAIEEYRRAVELNPLFMATHLWFGRPYLEKGMFAEAIAELETAVRLSGDSTVALAMLGHSLAAAGRAEEAQRILDQLRQRAEQQYVPSYWMAVVYNGLRDREQVLTWLHKAYEERSSWLVWANVEPRFSWLKPDHEFTELMRSMKFP